MSSSFNSSEIIHLTGDTISDPQGQMAKTDAFDQSLSTFYTS